MAKRTVLVDGDILAYQAATLAEQTIDWGDDLWTIHADAEVARSNLDASIKRVQDITEANAVVIALTDSAGNYRKRLYPPYKSARTKKPMVLPDMRRHLIDTYDAKLKPMLEGDDVLGILATHPKLVPGEKVIWTIDKDLKGIPGLIWDHKAEKVVEVSQADADRFHLTQVLTGDATDGYPGCPGVGPKKAEAILGELSGSEAWAAIVTTYTKAGLNEEAALIQARLARILRSTDYDFKKKEPILWSPTGVTK